MALGAVQAVKSAGKQDQVIVVGDDAIPAALEALKSGEMLATIDGNTDRVGYEAVKTGLRGLSSTILSPRPGSWCLRQS